jgi:hypothetical protein
MTPRLVSAADIPREPDPVGAWIRLDRVTRSLVGLAVTIPLSRELAERARRRRMADHHHRESGRTSPRRCPEGAKSLSRIGVSVREREADAPDRHEAIVAVNRREIAVELQ